MDKYLHLFQNMRWNWISIPKIEVWERIRNFIPHFNRASDYVRFMLNILRLLIDRTFLVRHWRIRYYHIYSYSFDAVLVKVHAEYKSAAYLKFQNYTICRQHSETLLICKVPLVIIVSFGNIVTRKTTSKRDRCSKTISLMETFN